MFNIIPLIIILISLSIIIVIVVRKFSVLASLDVDTIQEERELKMKEQIIGTRIKRNFFKYYSKIFRFIVPIGEAITKFFRWSYGKLTDYRENYKDSRASQENETALVERLMTEARDLVKRENFEDAEKKYIEIIGLEPRHVRAFKELGQLYYIRKDFNEAKQTYEHVLKLMENELSNSSIDRASHGNSPESIELNSQIASIYFEYSLVNKSLETYKEAQKTINQALKIEPNNPRYLDTKLEISIINKDKGSALDAYDKLKEVNPENQKLEDFKKEIDEI